ncbi:MAG: DNA adenine methylase [Enterocloster sp.]
MSIELLGNKRQLEAFLMENMGRYTDESCRVCLDLFSGSGSVSAAFKKRGYQVIANDFLAFAETLTKAVLLNDRAPAFAGILPFCGEMREESEAEPGAFSAYRKVLHYLNNLPPRKGFIHQHYSPASEALCGVSRMYFTEENAGKIDAIRMQIRDWSALLTESESALLLSDLLKAVAAVSNIAGTYGCYMKYWKKKALQPVFLTESSFVAGNPKGGHRVFCRDANEIIGDFAVDLVYADPPYTKRQYSAYYHILETIALYDEPELTGKTGLRNWQEKSSDYCFRRKAPGALEDLLDKARCRYFVLSYNDESQIPHSRVMEILSRRGQVTVCETPYKRYKSNVAENDRDGVIERLYIVEMEKK